MPSPDPEASVSGIGAFDVVGVGSELYRPGLPAAGVPGAGGPLAKVRMQAQTRTCGGQIATALATCASLGLRAAYLGAVGDDDDGRRIRAELGARGIDVQHRGDRRAPSASATILIDATGERSCCGIATPSCRTRLQRLPRDVIAAARLLHVDDVDVPAALAAARVAREAGIPVTCDIDHVTPGTRELLQLVSHPVFAEQVPLAPDRRARSRARPARPPPHASRRLVVTAR